MREVDAKPLVLGGLTGSGNRLVGNVLADWIARRRVDGDEGPVEVVESVLRTGDSAVVTSSGHTLLTLHDRGALDGSAVVWLRASPRTLVTRANGGMVDRRAVRMSSILAEIPLEHEILRLAVADAVIDVDELDLFSAASAVLAELRAEVGERTLSPNRRRQTGTR